MVSNSKVTYRRAFKGTLSGLLESQKSQIVLTSGNFYASATKHLGIGMSVGWSVGAWHVYEGNQGEWWNLRGGVNQVVE